MSVEKKKFHKTARVIRTGKIVGLTGYREHDDRYVIWKIDDKPIMPFGMIPAKELTDFCL